MSLSPFGHPTSDPPKVRHGLNNSVGRCVFPKIIKDTCTGIYNNSEVILKHYSTSINLSKDTPFNTLCYGIGRATDLFKNVKYIYHPSRHPPSSSSPHHSRTLQPAPLLPPADQRARLCFGRARGASRWARKAELARHCPSPAPEEEEEEEEEERRI